MSALPPVYVELRALIGDFQAKIGAAKKELGALAAENDLGASKFEKFQKYAVAAGVVGLGAMAVGAYKAAKAAAEYQTQLSIVYSTTGEVRSKTFDLQNKLLDLGTQVGYSGTEMGKAFYYVASGGYHAAAGLTVLKAAAQGAQIEGSDLVEVTHAVTGVMAEYHLKASMAARVTSAMTAAVGHGMMTFNDLAEALPRVGSRAAAAHVTIQELLGAMATMTRTGLPASMAATYLGQTIGHLEAPSKAAVAEMNSLGINATKLEQTLGNGSGPGLADAIGMLYKGIATHLTPAGLVAVQTFVKSKASAKDYHAMLAKLPPSMQTVVGAVAPMSGGVKGLQGTLMLGGKNLKSLRSNVAAVSDAMHKGGKDVTGWAEKQKTAEMQVKLLKAAAENLEIKLGTDLLPAVTKITAGLARFVGVLEKHPTAVRNFAMALAALLTTMVAVGSAKKVIGLFKDIGDAAMWSGRTVGKAGKLILRGMSEAEFQGARLGRGFKSFGEAAMQNFRLAGAYAKDWARSAGAALKDFGSSAKDSFSLAKGYAKDWSSSAATAIKDMAQSYGRAFQSFASSARLNLAKVGAWAKEAGTNAVSSLTSAFKSAGSSIASGLSTAKTAILDLGSRGLAAAKNMASLAASFTKAGLAAAASAIKMVAVKTVQLAIAAATKLWTAAQWLLNAALDANPIGIVVLALAALALAIYIAWTHSATFRRIVTDAFNAVKEAIHWVVNFVIGLFNKFGDKLLFLLGPIGAVVYAIRHWREIVTIVTDVFNSAKNAVEHAITNVKNSIRNGINNALSWLRGTANNWYNIGINIVEGIIHGVEHSAGALLGTMKNMASNALSSVKSFLGINSPSRKFRDVVGMAIPEGIAVGVDQHADKAVQSVRNLSQKLLKQQFQVEQQSNYSRLGSSALSLPGAGQYGQPTQPMIVNLNVKGEVDGQQVFKIVQSQSLRWGKSNGRPAFSMGAGF